MLNGTCLSVHAATSDKNDGVKLAESFGSLQRLPHHHAVGFVEEVLFEGSVVDYEVP